MKNETEKPQDMADVFVRDNLEFMIPLQKRSQVLKTLREHFKVTEKLVLEPKEEKT